MTEREASGKDRPVAFSSANPLVRMRTLVSAIMVLAFGGCYYDKEELLYPGTVCDTATVTYSGTISNIINSNCATAGCHVTGGTGTGVFTTYAGVKTSVDNGTFRTQVLELRSMPPSFALSSCELQQIQIWLDAGSPDN